MPSGIIKLNTDDAIWPYGTFISALSKIYLPNVKIQSGVIAIKYKEKIIKYSNTVKNLF